MFRAKKQRHQYGYRQWNKRWMEKGADRQKLPYELLLVNASTIGVHLLVGILMILGFWLGKIV